MSKPTCVLVLWPLAGNPNAWRRPRYVPVSFRRLISSRIFLRRSFSIFISESAAVRSRTCLLASSPTRHVGWMWKRDNMRDETSGPTPKKLWSDFCIKRRPVRLLVWCIEIWWRVCLPGRDFAPGSSRRGWKPSLILVSWFDNCDDLAIVAQRTILTTVVSWISRWDGSQAL